MDEAVHSREMNSILDHTGEGENYKAERGDRKCQQEVQGVLQSGMSPGHVALSSRRNTGAEHGAASAWALAGGVTQGRSKWQGQVGSSHGLGSCRVLVDWAFPVTYREPLEALRGGIISLTDFNSNSPSEN